MQHWVLWHDKLHGKKHSSSWMRFAAGAISWKFVTKFDISSSRHWRRPMFFFSSFRYPFWWLRFVMSLICGAVFLLQLKTNAQMLWSSESHQESWVDTNQLRLLLGCLGWILWFLGKHPRQQPAKSMWSSMVVLDMPSLTSRGPA